MTYATRTIQRWGIPGIVGAIVVALSLLVQPAHAITQIPDPEPKPGSFGLAASKTQAPPTQGATISTPGSGAGFTNSPITVAGICPNGLLVQLYDNGVMVGSSICNGGSFSMQVSLFAGDNELTVTVFDDLGQAGPTSAPITVTYTDTHFSAFGSLVTLTSSYGRRSAPAGTSLTWPLQLSGGSGPYAFSIDWGDGSKPQLKSQAFTGVVPIDHPYKKAGIYTVSVTATDTNGVSAFLQVVAVSSGKVDSTTGTVGGDASGAAKVAPPQVLWVPTIIMFALFLPTFWLGRLSQMVSIRNKMLKERDTFENSKNR